MALERAIAQLVKQLEALRGSLDALSYPLLTDRSRTEDLALSGYFGDSVTEVMNLLHEAVAAAAAARRAAKHPADLDGVRTGLVRCQEKFGELASRFQGELASFGNIEELSALKQRGGQWRKWVKTVATGLQESQDHLTLTTEKLMLCWQELAERSNAISIRNTAIGRKSITRIADAGLRVGEGTS